MLQVARRSGKFILFHRSIVARMLLAFKTSTGCQGDAVVRDSVMMLVCACVLSPIFSGRHPSIFVGAPAEVTHRGRSGVIFNAK